MDPKTGNSIYHCMDYYVRSMVILGMEYEMNERIKQLAREAGAHISTRNLMSNPPKHVETVELWDDRIEKFSELIVRECVRAGGQAFLHDNSMVPTFPSEQILKHFGVES